MEEVFLTSTSAGIITGAISTFILNRYIHKLPTFIGTAKKAKGKWREIPVPTAGGFIMLTSWLTACIYAAIKGYMSNGITWISTGILAMFIIGWLDDYYGTLPGWKLAGQITALLIILSGFYLLYKPPIWFLTLAGIWLLASTNAWNFIDNMDGVLGWTALAFLLAFLSTYGLKTIEPNPLRDFFFVTSTTLSWSLLFFLTLNYPVASLYAGDKGSHLCGVFAGILTIELARELPLEELPRLIMLGGFPMLDFSFVILSRLKRRKPPWIGGTDHLTHWLARKGVPEKLVPVITGTITLGLTLAGLLLPVQYLYALLIIWACTVMLLVAIS